MSEYIKRVKTPIIEATITRFFEDQLPSVDGSGDTMPVNVVSCDIDRGFDQATSSCTLVVKNIYDSEGNVFRFKPMDRVKIKQGWNTSSTLKITFFGFVDRADLHSPNSEQRLECRDILKVAQDNYLIQSNRKVYFKDPVADEVDDEGNPMGGQPPEDRTVKAIISELLTGSGIGTHRQVLDDELDNIIIGNNAVAVFVYESALDAINRICELIGYRLWADPIGCIRCKETANIASGTPAVTYQSQEETYNEDSMWTVTTSGNLLTVKTTRADDVRNWITVIGWGDLNVSVIGDSPYVPDPPKYKRVEIRSYLLDTYELLIAVATRVYNDLNRLRYTASASIEGDPRLSLGTIVRIYDPFSTYVEVDYILNSYSSRFTAGSWLMDLTLTGGVGEGSPPAGRIAPIALFEYSVEREGLVLDDVIAVTVDGSESYSPEGLDLSYIWTCSGYLNATGVRHVYVTDALSPLTVTLTVTDDGEPPLSDNLTRVVSLLPEEGTEVEEKVLFVGSGSKVFSTLNSGRSWSSSDIGETTSCVAADCKANAAIVGTMAGGIWKTDDGGETWSKIHDLSGEIISDIYIDHIKNLVDYPSAAVAYVGTHSGKLYKTVDSMGSWNLIHTFDTDIKQIMSSHTNASKVAIGCEDGVWVSINGGTNWTLSLSIT